MFGKKLKTEDLEEIKKRVELINQYFLVAQALEIQKQVYIKGILPKYGLDMNLEYEIDLKTGKIVPVKNKPEQKPQ